MATTCSYPAPLQRHLERMGSSSSVAQSPLLLSSLRLNRPLPAVPVPSEPSPAPPSPRSTVPARPHLKSRSRTGSLMLTRTLSSFMPAVSGQTFVASVRHPRLLEALIAFLDWNDFLSVANTCRQCRTMFRDPALRDTVFARFVPGFAHVLRKRDLQEFKDVNVSLHDLDLFLISQSVPLHRYPMHSLAVQSSLLPSLEQDQSTAKLVTLAEAHSRIVLLIQSIAHSSSSLPPPEPKETASKIRHPVIHSPSPHARELSFPAPLYKHQSTVPKAPKTAIDPLIRDSSIEFPSPQHSRSASSKSASLKPPRSSGDSSPYGTLNRRMSRLSIFGSNNAMKVVPPPPSDPKTLKLYSSSWRRTLFSTSGGLASDDEDMVLERPHRRFASSTGMSSSDSSVSNGGNSRDSGESPTSSTILSPTTIQGRRLSPSPLLPASSSPHDILLATSRVRAPVLRVFHPCTDLSEDSPAVQQCEEQLMESGLWDHLSTGDIVVNLGYVPPADSDASSDESLPRQRKQWLMFNGEVLIPYAPPEQTFPLPNPLTLPSPFYYSHIFPPNSNPIFTLDRLPQHDDVPQLTLVHLSTKVPSRRSPDGFMWVKRYAWTARVYMHGGITLGADEALGLGWLGEWVLQGDGTREGRRFLLDCLSGQNHARGLKWELVREKSGGGRVWFRLLTSYGGSTHDEIAEPHSPSILER